MCLTLSGQIVWTIRQMARHKAFLIGNVWDQTLSGQIVIRQMARHKAFLIWNVWDLLSWAQPLYQHPTWKVSSRLLMTASCTALCFLLHTPSVGGAWDDSSFPPPGDATTSFFLEDLMSVGSSLVVLPQISFSSVSGSPGQEPLPGAAMSLSWEKTS